jgi:hypothetical protein
MNNRDLALEEILARYIQTKYNYGAEKLIATMQDISKDSFSQLAAHQNGNSFLGLAIANNALDIFDNLWALQQDNLTILLHKNNQQQTLLDLAILHASYHCLDKIIIALEKHDKIEILFSKHNNADTLLHKAMTLEHSNKDAIVDLLLNKANKHLKNSPYNCLSEFINQTNTRGNPAIFYGFKYFTASCLNTFIDYGAQVDFHNNKDECLFSLFFSLATDKQSNIIRALNKNNQIYFLICCKDFYLSFRKIDAEKAEKIKGQILFLAKLSSMKFYNFLDNLFNQTVVNEISKLNNISEEYEILSSTIKNTLEAIETEIILIADKIEMRKYFYISDLKEQIKIYQSLDDYNKVYYLKHYIDFVNNHVNNHDPEQAKIFCENILYLAKQPLNIQSRKNNTLDNILDNIQDNTLGNALDNNLNNALYNNPNNTLFLYAKSSLTRQATSELNTNISAIIAELIKNKIAALHTNIGNVRGTGLSSNVSLLNQNRETLSRIIKNIDAYGAELNSILNETDSSSFTLSTALRILLPALIISIYIAIETPLGLTAAYYSDKLHDSGRFNNTAEKLYRGKLYLFGFTAAVFGMLGGVSFFIAALFSQFLVPSQRKLTLSSASGWAPQLNELKATIHEFNQLAEDSEAKQAHAINMQKMENDIKLLEQGTELPCIGQLPILFKQTETVKNTFSGLSTTLKDIRSTLNTTSKPISKSAHVQLSFLAENQNNKLNNDKIKNYDSDNSNDVIIEMNELDLDSEKSHLLAEELGSEKSIRLSI